MMNFRKYAEEIMLILIFIYYLIMVSIILYVRVWSNRNLNQDQDKVQDLNWTMTMTNSDPVQSYSVTEEEIITILFWTKYYDRFPFDYPSLSPLQEQRPRCFKECEIVVDRRNLNSSDAVLFHSRDLIMITPGTGLNSRRRRVRMPRVRPSDQIWIYFQEESPSHTQPDLRQYDGVFNWTMTYRRDSDVIFPYGEISRRPVSLAPLPLGQLEDILKPKRRLAFWIVSNCYTPGRRENLVAELQKYIPVDIYGGCGKYRCYKNGAGCIAKLAKYYKFYLSFENSLCRDYVTEKLYNALNLNVVPVVYGGANYDAFTPPNSVINVDEFKSTEDLANYLKYLDANPEKYFEYFEWKLEYEVKDERDIWKVQWCNLCRKLREHKRNPRRKVYRNLWEWWNFVYESKSQKVSACFEASSSLPERLPFDSDSDRIDFQNNLDFL